MQIVILGAGVIGVTTAYELVRSGEHDITVIDVNKEPALEASGVNAAMIAPGHAFAWASPKVPAILLKSLYRNDQAFKIRFRLDLQFWKWTTLFLKQCNNSDAVKNTIRKHTLCLYSQQRLHVVTSENNFEYDQIKKGLLFLFRNSKTLTKGIEHSKLLVNNGQQVETLNANEVIDIEPAYKPVHHKIAGAIYCPTDETGDARKFTRELVKICKSRGVNFQFDTKAIKLRAHQNQVQCVSTSKGDIEAELFIVSLGAHTPLILKTLGINLPIYPVKGYSITVPTAEHHQRLTIGTVDEDNLVALSPIGQELRATSTAEFAGYNLAHRPKDFEPMMKAVYDLLPNAADYSTVKYSACFRPMTPQGTPYIGFTQLSNLFVNSGQGHMGWTMACGSAKIAADLIAGRKPEIESSIFSPI